MYKSAYVLKQKSTFLSCSLKSSFQYEDVLFFFYGREFFTEMNFFVVLVHEYNNNSHFLKSGIEMNMYNFTNADHLEISNYVSRGKN